MSNLSPRTLFILMMILCFGLVSATSACEPAQKQQADHAYQIAYGFLKSKQWDQAIPQLESALGICSDHASSLRGLGKANYETGDFETSLAHYNDLLKVLGKNSEARDYMSTGKSYAKLKQYKQAALMYKRAAKLDPQNCGIQFNLGVMESAAKDYASAVETLEGIVDDCPDLSSKVLERLAKATKKARDKAQAKGDVEGARIFDEKYALYSSGAGGSSAYQLIKQHMRENDYAAAATECEKFLVESPDDERYKPKVLLNLARCRRELSQPGEAVQAYDQYLLIMTEDAAAKAERAAVAAGIAEEE